MSGDSGGGVIATLMILEMYVNVLMNCWCWRGPVVPSHVLSWRSALSRVGPVRSLEKVVTRPACAWRGIVATRERRSRDCSPIVCGGETQDQATCAWQLWSLQVAHTPPLLTPPHPVQKPGLAEYTPDTSTGQREREGVEGRTGDGLPILEECW